MKFEIDISGDELEILEDIVDEVNSDAAPGSVTRAQYLEGICRSWLLDKARDEAVYYARTADLSEIKKKIGSRRELRTKHVN